MDNNFISSIISREIARLRASKKLKIDQFIDKMILEKLKVIFMRACSLRSETPAGLARQSYTLQG